MTPVTATSRGASPVTVSLARSRFAPPGARAADPARVLGAGAVLALLGAVGWWAYVGLRALPEPGPVSVPVPPEVRVVDRPGRVTERKAVLSAAGDSNIFSHGRKVWTSQAGADPGPGAAAANGAQPPVDPSQVLAGDAVPSDIKPALDNLELKAIYASGDGLRALIGFNIPEPRVTSAYKEGDSFTDKQFPQAPWRLAQIDGERRRAILERAGRQVSLAMYKNTPGKPEVARAPAPGQKPPVQVVRQSREEILARLREAKISEADIAALVAAMDADEAKARDGGVAEAFKKAIGTQGDAAAPAGPPPGLEEILKLMASGQPPAAPKPASPPAEPGAQPPPAQSPPK